MKNENTSSGEKTMQRDALRQFFGSVSKPLLLFGPPSILVGMIIFFTTLNPRFATTQNLESLLRQAAVLSVVAVGGTFVIMIGSIDLSVEGIVSLSCIISVLTANYFSSSPMSGLLAVTLTIFIGTLFGLVNGALLSKAKLPSFLVTLGTMAVGNGAGLLITGGYTVPCYVASFRWFGVGDMLGIPSLGVFAIIMFALGIFLQTYTRFGRSAYAIGGGERVAVMSGVSVEKYKILVFVLAGALSGFAGALVGARIGAASAVAGSGLVLDAIAAVVMGGTPLTGGVGGVHRTIIGVFCITVLSNGLNIIGVSPHMQVVVKGIVVILAVAASVDRSKLPFMK